jgi:hypothetical protein
MDLIYIHGLCLLHTSLCSVDKFCYITAGIICVTAHPITNEIYYLLGQEPSKNNTWCDFGGRVELLESPITTASREFDEESLGVVKLFPDQYEEQTYVRSIHRLLTDQRYLLQISVVMPPSELVERLRSYFVIEVPWQPYIVEDFQRKRKLQQDARYLEKKNIRWWSALKIRNYLSSTTFTTSFRPILKLVLENLSPQ